LLDLFVNNEKTLLKMYEALFPHRVNTAIVGIEKPMNAGSSFYSQNFTG
jgi:hypothetical protein